VGLTVLLAAIAAPGASAKWTRFSPPTNSSVFAHMGVARTADGTLHVLWLTNENTPNETVMHTGFSATGQLRSTTTVSSGWQTLEPPAVVSGPDGSSLVAFWGGQRDPVHQELNEASSVDGGKTWTLAPYNLVSGEQVGMDTMSAARLGNTYYQAWGSYLHVGTTASPTNQFTASPADDCCGYDATVAALTTPQGSHGIYVAWYSNQANYDGVYEQAVDPIYGMPGTGGPPLLMPGSRGVGKALVPPAEVATTSGYVVVAYKIGYPSGNRLMAWLPGVKPVPLGSSQRDIDNFTLAADSSGRAWAAWAAFDRSGHMQIVVRRSDKYAQAWGQPVLVKPPGNTDLWTLQASTAGGALDLLGAFGDQGKIADYQTRVLPGLAVTASPATLRRSKRLLVQFRVVDAGSPVKGAKIRVGKASGHTNGQGDLFLKLGTFGPKVRRVRANITAAGYTGTSLRLTVR
jgi:hypothetical protein